MDGQGRPLATSSASVGVFSGQQVNMSEPVTSMTSPGLPSHSASSNPKLPRAGNGREQRRDAHEEEDDRAASHRGESYPSDTMTCPWEARCKAAPKIGQGG